MLQHDSFGRQIRIQTVEDTQPNMSLLAILLSLLGLIPFIVCGLAALSPDPATAARMVSAMTSYAAVMLGFVGGIHWGFELQSRDSPPAIQRARLGFGIVPPLIGWVALMLPLLFPYWATLLVLIAGYVGTALFEHQAARRELTPARYIVVRWLFTAVAVAMLTTVLTLRLLGQTIKF